MMNRILEIGKP